MKNDILQFINKQRLANALAAYDCLFVIESLRTFRKNLPLARFFLKKSPLPHSVRLQKFLRRQNNLLLYAFAAEITARTDIVGEDFLILRREACRSFCGEVLFRKAASLPQYRFYRRLAAELVKRDFPALAKADVFLFAHLDSFTDMRLYAAELENLYERIGDHERCCSFEVDWIKTGRRDLYLGFDEECRYTQKLGVLAQESLSKLFACLLFEKGFYISYWNAVTVNPNQKVCFLDFDYVYPADEKLQKFAVDYARNRRRPQSYFEFKLARAIRLLEFYCADIKCFRIWEPWLQQNFNPLLANEVFNHQNLVTAFKTSGVDLTITDSLLLPSAADSAYLLDDSRHRNDSRFKKSSFWYWAPLLIAAVLLLKFL